MLHFLLGPPIQCTFIFPAISGASCRAWATSSSPPHTEIHRGRSLCRRAHSTIHSEPSVGVVYPQYGAAPLRPCLVMARRESGDISPPICLPSTGRSFSYRSIMRNISSLLPSPYDGDDTIPSRSNRSVYISRCAIDWLSSGSVPPMSVLTSTRCLCHVCWGAANPCTASAPRIISPAILFFMITVVSVYECKISFSGAIVQIGCKKIPGPCGRALKKSLYRLGP